MVWVCSAVESFSEAADGDHVAAPGACDSAAHPTVTQINPVVPEIAGQGKPCAETLKALGKG